MWRGKQSIRFRLTMWYATAMAAGLLIFAAAAFWLIRREIEQRGDHLLDEASRAFASELVLEHQMLGTRERAIDEALRGVRFRGVTLGVMDPAGTGGLHLASDLPAEDPVADSARARIRRDLARAFGSVAPPSSRPGEFSTVRAMDGSIRVFVHAVRLGDSGQSLVVAASDRREDQETLKHVGLAFLALVTLFVLAAIFGGYALARQTLSPIANISQQAQAISPQDLSARVPVANPNDELGALSGVINDLLARIEGAFARQREFMADASHELRTPLAIVRNEANIALSIPERSAAEYRDALQIVERESERLSSLVEDLLLMARADAGAQPLRQEQLYLDDLLRDVAHATRSIADLRDVRLTVTAPADAEYRGDERLLRRAILNLVDNAIRHSPGHGGVDLALHAAPARWEIRVSDQGTGIPSELQGQLFNRFFQGASEGDRAPAASRTGAGLGLSIARWIAQAHRGALVLERTGAGGSTFLLTLPVVRS